jgi:hypothetical protein
MAKTTHAIMALAMLCGPTSAQPQPRPKYFDHARIQHEASGVTVIANDPLPLLQALDALRLEYGWQVNWEAAPGYSHFDVTDDTDPKWRAAHPDGKPVTRPSGGLFTASLPEPEATDAATERNILVRLIDEYNTSSNPGKYVLRIGLDGELAVVGTRVRDESGTLQEIDPLLDTLVTLPKVQRNIEVTISAILDSLQSATGKKVIFAELSHSLFLNTQVTMGGEKIPARELLNQALASTKRPLEYNLGFNPDVPAFILNTTLAMQEEDNGLGSRRLVPIDRRH